MSEKKNWTVEIKCTVTKRVYLENCTAEQAEKEPWEHALEALETDMIYWDVVRVEEAI